VILADPGGLTAADIGLAWPARTGSTVFAVAVGAVVVGAQVSGARRVSRIYAGRPWPRHFINAALPRTPRERRLMPFAALTAGVGEELVFRGLFVAAGLGLLGLSPAVAVLVVAVAFGWAHLYQGPRGVALTALGAMYLGLLYLLSGSLLIPVLVHAGTDAVAFLCLRPTWPAGDDPGGSEPAAEAAGLQPE
jgi:membrane protease YdiL (CAAX protease family)